MAQKDQLGFGFLTDIDREYAEQQKREEVESRQRNADGHLLSNVNEMPPAKEEWENVILMGIRLCRHIHGFECAGCKLDRFNHCPDVLGTYYDDIYKGWNPVKVCLKDYFAWCARNGRKDLIRRQTYGETTTYA